MNCFKVIGIYCKISEKYNDGINKKQGGLYDETMEKIIKMCIRDRLSEKKYVIGTFAIEPYFPEKFRLKEFQLK